MTWTLVQKSASEAAGTATSITPTLPSGSTAGNLLVATLSAGAKGFSLPAGWVLAADANNGGERADIWHYINNPGGISSVVCSTADGSSQNLKGELSEYHSDVAGATVTLNATGTAVAGNVSTVAVTTGTAAAAGDLVICSFHERFTSATAITWTTPSGFTLIQDDTASDTHHHFGGYQLSAPGGTQTVTGKSSVAAGNTLGWTGAVATYTAAVITAPSTQAPVFGMDAQAPWSAVEAALAVPSIPGWRAYNGGNAGVPNSWPGADAPVPAGVTTQVVSFKPALPISAADQASLATLFSQCPAGSCATIWGEGEGSGYTAAQIIAGHVLARQIFKANAPATAKYVQVLMTYTGYSGSSHYPLKQWVCCPANGGVLLDMYCADWYPATASDASATTAINNFMDATNGLTAVVTSPVIGIAECGYTTSIFSGITWLGTTVASGSNGGVISSIGSWSSPSAGTLAVASTSNYASSGTFWVACSDGVSVARVTYTGTTSTTFTGCAYVSGASGKTVATGGQVLTSEANQSTWFSQAWAWATANGAELFFPYYYGAHGVPWPPSAAAITELAAIYAGSSRSLLPAAAGLVGAFVNPLIFGAGTTTQQGYADFANISARSVAVLRSYHGTIPAAITADLQAAAAAGRKAVIDLKPAVSPTSTGDYDRISTFLASCQANNPPLQATVTLWAEPINNGITSAAAYKTMFAFYAPAIRANGYQAAFCMGGSTAANRNETSYYPGDANVDVVAVDYYASRYVADGQTTSTLSLCSALADNHLPAPVPFGIYEANGNPAFQTQKQITAYFAAVQAFMLGRLGQGLNNGDLICFNSPNTDVNQAPITTASDFRIPLYQAWVDNLSGAGGTTTPPVPGSIASEVDFTLTMNTVLTTSSTPPPSVPAGPSDVLPQVFAELGFSPAAPVVPPGTFILDDPVNGRLDFGRLAPATAWTDTAGLLRTASIVRPSTRLQGPLIAWQAATCQVTWDNSDGRFDPDNPGTPYVTIAGASQIRPMLPFRVRAAWAGQAYSLYSGFADSWSDGQVTYDAGYAESVMGATDGFKALAGITLPSLATGAGAGEKSGSRINRVLNSAGWYTDHRQIAAGDSAVQATTYGDTALNLLQLAALSEIGQLYADGAGNMVFRNRHALLTQTRSNTSQATFSDNPPVANHLPAADQSFETALTGNWIIWANITSLTQSAAQAYDGTHSLAVAITGAGIAQWIYNPQVRAAGGYPYQLTAAVNAPAADTGFKATCFWFNAAGTQTGSANLALPVSAAGWQQVTGTVTPPPGTATVQLWFTYTAGGAGTLYFDAVYWQPAPGPVYATLTRADDDTTLANDVQVTTAGGTPQEARDAASIAAYLFPRTYPAPGIILTSDAETLTWAQWVVYVSKTDDRRFDQVTIDPLADPARLYPQVLGREIGDRITILRRPASTGTVVSKDCFIRGIRHDIDATAGTWLTTWDLQDAARYGSFFTLDDPVNGQLNHSALAY